jgi:hypothetical protein
VLLVVDNTPDTAKNGGARRLPQDKQRRGEQKHVSLPHGFLRSNCVFGRRENNPEEMDAAAKVVLMRLHLTAG